jgi:L-alanine-DL-glutamate epimerase-like enolase superfamily enzyme
VANTIVEVRVHAISVPLDRAYWMSLEPYTCAAEVLVEVTTDDGCTGIGQIHGRPQDAIVDLLRHRVGPMLLGADPWATEELWDRVFRLTFNRDSAHFAAADGQPHFGAGVKPQLMAALAGVDIALWDVKAQQAGVPLFRLLGGSDPVVEAYASGGYYGPEGEPAVDLLVDEMREYVAAGYEAVKMKVGGASLDVDVKRVAAVREALPDIDIMIDANSAYTVPEAMAAAEAYEPLQIRWFEEPVAWFDPVRGTAKVAATTSIPIASGEQEIHRWSCRDLVENGGIQVLQFDCTRAGGVTDWLKVAAHASAHGVLMAPHHDPQLHGHLLAAVPNGHVQEVFPNAARDPLWDRLFAHRPSVHDGRLHLEERPGLGIELDRDALVAFSTSEPLVLDQRTSAT